MFALLKVVCVNFSLYEYMTMMTLQNGPIKAWHFACLYLRQLLTDFPNFLLAHSADNLQ